MYFYLESKKHINYKCIYSYVTQIPPPPNIFHNFRERSWSPHPIYLSSPSPTSKSIHLRAAWKLIPTNYIKGICNFYWFQFGEANTAQLNARCERRYNGKGRKSCGNAMATLVLGVSLSGGGWEAWVDQEATHKSLWVHTCGAPDAQLMWNSTECKCRRANIQSIEYLLGFISMAADSELRSKYTR